MRDVINSCLWLLPLLRYVQGMLDEVGSKSVVVGGTVDVQDHFVAPTVLKGERKSDKK